MLDLEAVAQATRDALHQAGAGVLQTLLNEDEILALAREEYSSSKRLPCEGITVDCTNNTDTVSDSSVPVALLRVEHVQRELRGWHADADEKQQRPLQRRRAEFLVL